MSKSDLEGLEKAGIQLITQAVQHERDKRLREALSCFTEGIGLLLQVHKELQNKEKKESFEKQIGNYIDHAEEVKKAIAKQEKERAANRQVCIEEDATGHTYESLFGSCLDGTVTAVDIDDAYIQNHHQVQNFVRFCELILSKGKTVREIKLVTQQHKERDKRDKQVEWLAALTENLRQYNVKLEVQYSETQHDREIRFNNGWVVKIGRGLDFYKPLPSNLIIGACDFSFRPCKQTTVDFMWRAGNKK